VKVNALWDDGSTKSYINEDVSELGLSGAKQRVQVNVINGKTETFNTMTVNFQIESVVHNTRLNMEAQTTRNVTGTLKAID